MTNQRRFLFVDRDPKTRTTLALDALRLGLTVDLACSAADAASRMRSTSYPVVVTNVALGESDGLALVREISAFAPTTAFVLLSERSTLGREQVDEPNCAVASLLTRPWRPEQLEKALDLAFALHEGRATRESSPPASCRLLVVEDNGFDADLLRYYASSIQGAEVLHAGSIREALTVLGSGQVDVIITDMSLPDAQGLDSVTELRAAAPEAALIACSGVDDEVMALQALDAGVQEVLLKNGLDAAGLRRAVHFARKRRRDERELGRLAHFDALTGLANRSSLGDRMASEMARARRLRSALALMIIDLDGFKPVNDQHGHHAGDRLLQEIATRMRRTFREYDCIARLGGDEFAVLLSGISGVGQVEVAATRLLQTLAMPVELGVTRPRVTASIGVAMFPETAASAEELFARADAAMYEAKRRGKNCLRIALPGWVSDESRDQNSIPTVRPRARESVVDSGFKPRPPSDAHMPIAVRNTQP